MMSPMPIAALAAKNQPIKKVARAATRAKISACQSPLTTDAAANEVIVSRAAERVNLFGNRCSRMSVIASGIEIAIR